MFEFFNSEALDAEISANSIISVKVKSLSERHWSSRCDLRYTKTVSAFQIKITSAEKVSD